MSNEGPIPLKWDRHATIRITTKNPNNRDQIVNISGAQLVFQCKDELSTGATVLFERKNTAAGGDSSQIEEVEALVSGVYRVHTTPDNLTGLSIGGTYWVETKMTSGGKDSTIFQEEIMILPSLVD